MCGECDENAELSWCAELRPQKVLVELENCGEEIGGSDAGALGNGTYAAAGPKFQAVPMEEKG